MFFYLIIENVYKKIFVLWTNQKINESKLQEN